MACKDILTKAKVFMNINVYAYRFFISAFILLILSVSSAPAAPVIKIKLGTLSPKGTIYYKKLNKIRTQLLKLSKGRLKIVIFDNSRAGDEKKMIKNMKRGKLQMAHLTGIGLGRIYKPIKIMDMPFFYGTKRQLEHVKKKIAPVMKKGFKKNGFILTGWSHFGDTYMLANRPIRSERDLKGIKIWSPVGDQMVKSLWEMFAVVPVYLETSQINWAANHNKLDATFSPPAAIIGFQWYRKFRYIMTPALANIQVSCVIEKKFFDSLPKNMSKLLLSTTERYCSMSKALIKANRSSIRALKRRGIKFIKLDPAFIKDLKKKSKGAVKKLVKKRVISPKIMKLVNKYMKEVR